MIADPRLQPCPSPDAAVVRAQRGQQTRCAIYARVALKKQVRSGELDRQRERLVTAAYAKGYYILAEVVDLASGLSEKRSGLRRLFHMAEAGTIDVVLIESQDRLARFGFTYLAEAFAARGVRVEVLDGALANDPVPELVIDIQAIVGRFAPVICGERGRLLQGKVTRVLKEAMQRD